MARLDDVIDNLQEQIFEETRQDSGYMKAGKHLKDGISLRLFLDQHIKYGLNINGIEAP